MTDDHVGHWINHFWNFLSSKPYSKDSMMKWRCTPFKVTNDTQYMHIKFNLDKFLPILASVDVWNAESMFDNFFQASSLSGFVAGAFLRGADICSIPGIINIINIIIITIITIIITIITINMTTWAGWHSTYQKRQQGPSSSSPLHTLLSHTGSCNYLHVYIGNDDFFQSLYNGHIGCNTMVAIPVLCFSSRGRYSGTP